MNEILPDTSASGGSPSHAPQPVGEQRQATAAALTEEAALRRAIDAITAAVAPSAAIPATQPSDELMELIDRVGWQTRILLLNELVMAARAAMESRRSGQDTAKPA